MNVLGSPRHPASGEDRTSRRQDHPVTRSLTFFGANPLLSRNGTYLNPSNCPIFSITFILGLYTRILKWQDSTHDLNRNICLIQEVHP